MKTLSDYSRSIRYVGLATIIAAVSVIQGCSSDTIPTAPSADTRVLVPDTRPLVPAPTQLRVSGMVTDDEGIPVAGVKVTVYRWTAADKGRSAVTDGRGFYSISFASADGIAARTEKQGYESEWHTRSISAAADFEFDLRIHRLKQ